MKAGYKITLSIFAVLAIAVGVAYYYRKPFYLEYQKRQFEAEFVCPENQTSDQADAYLYRFIKFYMDNYPSMKLSDFLTIRYNQLVRYNCAKTLANIANSDAGNATTSADTGNPTLGELRQSSSNVPIK